MRRALTIACLSMAWTIPGSPKVEAGQTNLGRNLNLWCQHIGTAGQQSLDIVCLSKVILLLGTEARACDVAEPIPGPSTERLGAAARRNRLWAVAGLMEQEGDRLYNTAVWLDRAGKLVGKYRKVHLPRGEWQKGTSPGHDYPVFQTDFGTIAIPICYDFFFPQSGRGFAQARKSFPPFGYEISGLVAFDRPATPDAHDLRRVAGKATRAELLSHRFPAAACRSHSFRR